MYQNKNDQLKQQYELKKQENTQLRQEIKNL